MMMKEEWTTTIPHILLRWGAFGFRSYFALSADPFVWQYGDSLALRDVKG